jgi:hypothetical protein
VFARDSRSLRRIRSTLGKLLHRGDFLYRIVSLDLTQLPDTTVDRAVVRLSNDGAELSSSDHEGMRTSAKLVGCGAVGFALWHDERLASVCYIWQRARYASINYWPIDNGEGKLVHIYTRPNLRERGLATRLILGASQEMKRLGFDRLYARISHTNSASFAAFTRAGWQHVAD